MELFSLARTPMLGGKLRISKLIVSNLLQKCLYICCLCL